MKIINKTKYILSLAGVLVLVTLSACSGSGSCPPGTNGGGSAGEVTLKLTAPNQYPAGMSTPITAYLTMTNTSDVNATNLYYAIPSASNYTGVAITVANDSTNPCRSIASQQSCTFPVTIAAYANPGSFTVTATPNSSSSSQSTIGKLISNFENKLGMQSGTLELTANIGLTNVPVNTNSGANGITFLYSNTVAAAESGSTLLSIVGVVNSASAGSFNTINLTDQSGNLLNFTVSSGNSGSGAANLAQGSIVTFLLKIPASATGSTFNFYAQTIDNNGSGTVNQGTLPNPITLGTATAGILVVQPTNFSLTSPNYESQVITFTNIGNGGVSSLSIQTPAAPLYVINNGCGSSLAAGLSCTYVLGFHATPGFSGDSGLTASYNNGSTTTSVSAQVHYAGVNPIAGISVTSGDNPTLNFVGNTESSSASSQLTLSNSGNVSESNFVFTVPQYFVLTAGTTGAPCTLSANTVTTVLAKNASCTLTLTYTNGTDTNGAQPANLLVDYKYNGVDAPQSSIPLTYETVQVSGLLQVSSPALPYTFPNIQANGSMSESQVFVYTNIGTGTATNVSVNPVLQMLREEPAVFAVVPSQPSASNDCGSSITSLTPGNSCQVTVQFGPISASPDTYNKQLQLSYESTLATTPLMVPAALSGTALPLLSANIIVSSVSLSPEVLGGDGSSATPFAFDSSTPSVSITLTYKNIGTDAAQHFTVDASNPSIGTLQANNCNNVESFAINATCTVVINYSTAVGQAELHLDSEYMPISWSDDSGSYTGMGAQWDNNGTMQSGVFLQIYPASNITITTAPSPVGNVPQSGSFPIIATLSSSTTVANQTVHAATIENGVTFTNNDCTVSTENPSCTITVNISSSATIKQDAVVTLANQTGGVSISPVTVDFNITPVWTPIGMALVTVNSTQYAYVTDYNSPNFYRCTLKSNGTFNNCIDLGNGGTGWVSTAGVTYGMFNSVPYLYITDKLQGGTNQCSLSATGTLDICNQIQPSDNGANQQGITIATVGANQILYITNNNYIDGFTTSLYSCMLDAISGLPSSTCGASGAPLIWNTFAINFATFSATQYAYIAKVNGDDLVSNPGIAKCSVNSVNGSLSACALTPSSGAPSWQPQDVVFYTAGNATQYAYVADTGGGNIYQCSLDGSGNFSMCTASNGNMSPGTWNPVNIVFATANSTAYAYVTSGSTVYQCTLNFDGTLNNCVNTISWQ